MENVYGITIDFILKAVADGYNDGQVRNNDQASWKWICCSGNHIWELTVHYIEEQDLDWRYVTGKMCLSPLNKEVNAVCEISVAK